MPVRFRRTFKRRSVKGRRQQRRRLRSVGRRRPSFKRRSVGGNKHYAVYSETAEFAMPTTGTVGSFATSLAAMPWDLSQDVAQQYRYYRCKSLEFTFLPAVTEVNSDPVTGSGTIPFFYFRKERINDAAGVSTVAQMQDIGCKPIQFTRPIKIMMKPNTLAAVTNSSGGAPSSVQTSTPVFNRWFPTTDEMNLGTNTQAVDYFGLLFVVEQSIPGPRPPSVYTVRVTWEFKGPWIGPNDQPQSQARTTFASPSAIAVKT